MDFKQLLTLREIARTGSVSAAARKLGRTQPAVSHMLSKLEDELGMLLFERRNGRLFPMPETDYLFRQASKLLNDLDEIGSTMRRLKEAKEGTLRIVSMPGPAVEFLPALIAAHMKNRPGVQTTLLSRSSEAVHRLVEAQQFDIGLADHLPQYALGPNAHRRTFSFPRFCAVATNHPLAAKPEIELRDLSGMPLATLFPEHATTRELRLEFELAGHEFTPRFEGQFFLHLLPYVLSGLACALVDPIAMTSWKSTHRFSEGIRFLPLKSKLRFELDLITPAIDTRSQLSRFFEARILEALCALQETSHYPGIQ